MPDDAINPQHPAPGRGWNGPIDPDVDLHQSDQRREWTAHRWTLPTIALGGMIGASARHALELWWPTTTGSFPWATFVTNVSGCALIGLLMVYVVDLGAGHPLLRPFLGVGVLGGYTTFSTYAVQTDHLVSAGAPALALTYLVGSVAAALVAVAAGTAPGRAVLTARQDPPDLPPDPSDPIGPSGQNAHEEK